MFSVYILWSEKLRKFYIGHTDNLPRRMEEHNSGRSVYTKKGDPWILIYHEDCENRSSASKRELYI